MTAAVLLSTAAAAVEADNAKTVPERDDIETKYLWATEQIFPTVSEWEEEFEKLEAKIDEAAQFRGTLSDSAEALLRVLNWRDAYEPKLERLWVYASLLADQDTRVSKHQAMRDKVRSLFVRYSAEMAWLDPELTSIPWDTLESWMSQNDQLAMYRQALHNLFRQKEHILSESEEQLISLAGQVFSVPYSTYSLLSNADIQFPEIKDAERNTVELSDSSFYQFMRSPDRGVRRDAYEGIVGSYAKYKNTTASLLNGAVQSHVFTVRARNYDSCLAAALDGGNIPVEVYDTLVQTINENLHLLHRYQQLRKRALRFHDGVHAYDLFAPFPNVEPIQYSYEEAVAAIRKALKPLGKEYVQTMSEGFDSRWVDVFPTKGKRSGAYSSGSFLTQPYILMNFHGGYDDVSTLAHEMGHSMHSYLSRSNQPYVYADYDIFCAEVASTTNEVLLQQYILKQIDNPRQKLFLLGEFLETFRGTIFRQTMFSEFEQRIHEMAEQGIPLTADSLGETYGGIMKKYYGDAYIHDELVDNYWIRIPHFYYNFYVYKYSTSFCAASNIARRIQDGQPNAVEDYLTFLKSGSSKYPVELLNVAGVDMTSPKPFEDAMRLFEELLNETERLLSEMEMI